MKLEKNDSDILLSDLMTLIKESKRKVVMQVNSSLTLLFWQIGDRINKDILKTKRAGYGKQIVVTVSRQLVKEYGRNYEEKNLRRMVQFAKKYSNYERVLFLSNHLSWSHFLTLIPLKSDDARKFYGDFAYNNLIGVRGLRTQISRKVYERTKTSDISITENKKIEKGIFKDPYFLDFLELKEGYLEGDLESAILK